MSTSAHKKEKYASQGVRTVTNKRRRLAKHLKNQPNDSQAQKLLK